MKEMVLRAYQERCSLRGVERIFHVSRHTVPRWLKEAIQPYPSIEDTLLPADETDVLELDELWSFVLKKDQKRDFWQAYQVVFDAETHQSVGKESGETAHIERFNGTLRQRWARFVRKTLSFSKSDRSHHIVTLPAR